MLLTMLKELCITKGTVQVSPQTVTYAEQNPLIVSGTVRDNIVFGEDFDEDRYWEVIEACSLKEDFERMA